MAFKDSKSFSDAKTNFTNEMARFVSKEASYFSSGDNEAASANVDAAFEKAVTYSAGKNAERVKQERSEVKKLKDEIKLGNKDIKMSEKRLESKKAEINSRTKQLETNIKKNAISKEQAKEERLKIKEDERFVKSETSRISDKRQDMNKSLDKKKEHKKKENKERKKQTTKLSVGNMLSSKKDISNELAGGGANTGDAFHDGRSGLVGTLLEVVNPMHYLKALMAKLAALLAPYVLLFMTIAIVVVIMVALIFDVLQPIVAVKDAISNFISFFTGEDHEDTFVNSTLSEDEINQIVAEITCTEKQEKTVRFALSKVGYPYSQDYRTSGNYYDCSSLAYYAWDSAGVDISNGGRYPPSAAEEARLLNTAGKALSLDVSSFSMEAGDLIFYGGSDNGRYKGIYHVAVYIGNGKVVEALNTKYGVVYRDLSVDDAIMICRPD